MRDKEDRVTIKAKQLLAKPPGGAMHQSRKCFRARSVHSDNSSFSPFRDAQGGQGGGLFLFVSLVRVQQRGREESSNRISSSEWMHE